jgi:putative FmdB family regulatory protein
MSDFGSRCCANSFRRSSRNDLDRHALHLALALPECQPTPAYVGVPVGTHKRRWSITEMPTYEYLCKTCGVQFDAVQSFKDDSFKKCDEAPINCPQGGGGDLRKVFGKVGITFKGSGFYKNDSRGTTSSTTPSTSSDSSSSSTASSGSSTSSDSGSSTSATPASSSSSDSHGHSHGAGASSN